MAFERIVEGTAAFDKRSSVPGKNYGIHGFEFRFLVKNDRGAVQFLLYTNWHLPHVQNELDQRPEDPKWRHLSCHPTPADLGYHSPVPHYEGQASMGPCPYLDGEPCFYDGSSLNAEKPYEILVAQGLDAMWAYLERYHAEVFTDG